MKKISFRAVLAQCGIGMLVIFLAFIGSFLIREARSFINPASGPGASGVLGPDVGVIGDPSDGISGANTLFKGQKAIADAVGGGGGGGLRTKRVFVTSTLYNGNLGGLAGADAKCQARADAATLGGTWKAILSDSTTNAAQRIGYNWDVLVDLYNRPVISRGDIWGQLYYDTSISTYHRIVMPILVNELNIFSGNNGGVWTATTADGLFSVANSCSNWTSSSSSFRGDGGRSYFTNIGFDWISGSSDFCNVSDRLYCIEQ